MTTLYTISDDLTKFCRKAMKANGGVWNPVTGAWMFTKADDHANAACELYRGTRPGAEQLEALLLMAVDGRSAGVGLRPERNAPGLRAVLTR